MTSEREFRVDLRLDRPPSQLIQPVAVPHNEIKATQIGQHRTAPQRQGAAEVRDTLGRPIPARGLLTGLDQSLELCCIDRVRIDVQAISPGFGDQDARRLSLARPGSSISRR